jgi:MoaA/NifB/PqqE/SkfB family radical SAM enzyme
MDLSIALTKRCNAQCTHCATNCGPRQKQSLATSTVFELMNEAAKRTPAGEILYFGLTGGEAFLDLEQLIEVIRHGVGLGGRVSCVTNAFWASSEEKAQTVAARVREAGLADLAVSTSQYHQSFVKIERVKRAVAAANRIGLNTTLKIAYTVQDEEDGRVQQWADFVGAQSLQIFPVVPFLRQGAALPAEHYVRTPGLPKGRCPSSLLTFREDGAAYGCCTPGGFEPMLHVGNVLDSSFDDILDRYHFDPVLQTLRERGPIHFARHAIAQGEGGRLRSGYADVCDLCAHIASDPALTNCARDSAQAFRTEWADRIAHAMRVKASEGGSTPKIRTVHKTKEKRA